MPIAANVRGLGVHLRTARTTKSAGLSQLADKETNTRTTKNRHEELRANCRALEVEVWLVQMMCGKWIGGMIFLLVGMFTNVLGPSAWRLREGLQNKFKVILNHTQRSFFQICIP